VGNGNFALALITLGLLYILREQISMLINNIFFENYENIKFKSIYLSYLLFFLLSITLVAGMMMGKKIVRKNFGNVSDGFKKLKPSDKDRPHPWFDIDTYW